VNIEVVPVRIERDLEQFIRLPWGLYKGDPNWVAPLISEERRRFDPRKNPFYEHAEVQLFLALRDGRPVGRLSAHIDYLHNEFHGERSGFFGFFEAPDDRGVAEALFEAAEGWLRARGMECIRGPFSFNTNDPSGLLVEGFDSPPALMMPYNPPYYGKLLEGLGFVKVKDLLAYEITIDEPFRERMKALIPRLEAIGRRARRQGVTVRAVNLSDFDGEVRRLMEVYNEAWERNWGFVPLTEREFVAQAKELKRIVIPELLVIAERGEEPIGFGLVLPDFNQALQPLRGRLFPLGIFKLFIYSRKITGLRFITLGIKRAHRKRGVDALIYLKMLEAGLKLTQYQRCECSWVLEDNHLMIRAIELVGGRLSKVYRIYEKPLR